MRLGKKFFARDTSVVARELIGKKFIRKYHDNEKETILSGIIVESEAYGYLNDPASHAYHGKTIRNASMFGSPGMSYVYLIYGNHFCFNITAKENDTIAGAVLIRSIEPIEGIEIMMRLRQKDKIYDIASGPGKLTKALGITNKENGIDVSENDSKIFFEDINIPILIGCTKRVGINKAVDKDWRYVMLNTYSNYQKILPSNFVSNKTKKIEKIYNSNFVISPSN